MRFLLFILDGRCDKRASVPQFSCLASELCSRRGAPRGAAALTNAPSRSPVLLSLAQSNFNGKFEGVWGSEVGFSVCQSCQLLPQRWECSARTPPGHGAPVPSVPGRAQGSAPGLCWEAQSRIKHSPPARKGGDQSCHCWKNRAGKKNPSSPCLACSTACLGFVSLGSQRSLLQSPECVWLLNSAAPKGDQDLFASPGQILLLCDSFVASATRSTWCLLGLSDRSPRAVLRLPPRAASIFTLGKGEKSPGPG